VYESGSHQESSDNEDGGYASGSTASSSNLRLPPTEEDKMHNCEMQGSEEEDLEILFATAQTTFDTPDSSLGDLQSIGSTQSIST